MLKKIALYALALLLPASGLAAPKTTQKVLVILGGESGSQTLSVGLKRVVALKENGVDVSVIFEREAVLCFLDFHDALEKPDWKRKLKELDALKAKLEKTSGPESEKTLRHPRFKVSKMNLKTGPGFKNYIKKMKDLRIPYVICNNSLRGWLGEDNAVTAAGEPLSPDKLTVVDIAPYLEEGYHVLIY